MNPRGHPNTLVAKHPGNQNAVKTGVFSPATLAPRVLEIEAAIAERPVDQVVVELVSREAASLAALGEAMDASLAKSGVLGRGGAPRRMIEHRLRLNEKLLRTIDRYEAAARGLSAHPPLDESSGAKAHALASLAEVLVEEHAKSPGSKLAAEDLDPEVFLATVIATEDQMTTSQDRVRARRILTRRYDSRPRTCTCIATLRARDAIELREWVAVLRDAGVEPAHSDRELAALVRTVARGETDDRLANYAA